MSVQRFAKEERLHGPEANGEPSVLTQARWKRLILGKLSARSRSDVRLIRQMRVISPDQK